MLCLPPPSSLPMGRVSISPTSLLYRFWPWRAGDTIHVQFLDGALPMWGKVADLITGPYGWNACSSVQFHFCQVQGCTQQEPHAAVRITFAKGSSWSYLGAYGNIHPFTGATMNLAVDGNTSYGGFCHAVLHEFGHALGLLHEQEHPQGLPWDVAAFERWHRERGYDVEAARQFWFRSASPDSSVPGPYDPNAIMHYYVPAEWMLDRVSRGGSNNITPRECAWVEHLFGPPPQRWGNIFLPIVRS